MAKKNRQIYKLIVAGGREFSDYNLMREAIAEFIKEHKITKLEIVSGGARGADSMGEEYAEYYGHSKHIIPADWNTHGKAGGYIRNMEMANYADGCIIFWDEASKGSKHMIDIAKGKDMPLKIVMY